MSPMLTFAQVLARESWTPIRDCPGRFVLRGHLPTYSLQDLLGHAPVVQRFPASAARDCVLAVTLDGGGIISYQRAGGTFVHTLNTAEGFQRKLQQLEIQLAPAEVVPDHP